jgi:hypothetical protein
LRLVGVTDDVQRGAAGFFGGRRHFGHDVRDRPPGLFQRREPGVQPGPVAGGDPDWRAGLGLRRNGKVQLGRVVQ